MERKITIGDLLGRRLIGWICNDANYDKGINQRCYVYPEYVFSEEELWLKISKDLFPKSGAIEVIMSGGEDSSDFIGRVGNIVEMNLSKVPQEHNNEDAQNSYISHYNSRNVNNSNIDIRSINTRGLIQILKYEDSIDLNKIGIEIPNYPKLWVNNVCLLADDGVYGPFTYNTHSDVLQLKASEKTEYQVGKFPKEIVQNKLNEVCDHHDISRVQFVPMEIIQFSEAVFVKDWMDDERLLKILGKLFKASEKNNFTRNNISVIKQSLLENQEVEKIGLTEERKQRLEKMLSDYSDNEKLYDDIVERAISNDSILDKIVDKIVSDYYNKIESKVMDHLEIEKKKEEQYNEIKKLKFEAEKLKEENEKLQANKDEVLEQSKAQYEDQLRGIKEEIKCKKEEKDQLLKKINVLEDIQSLKDEKESLELQYDKLKNEYIEQRARNRELQDQEKEIELSLINAVERFQQNSRIEYAFNFFNNRENNKTNVVNIDVVKDFTVEKMISEMVSYINEEENRKMTKNQVINILICLCQGFITTFAGEPGTGKTSLSTIIGKALGLKNSNANRMVEISVERGWTSYKDYIGYYNPLTRSLEKGNVEVFDSMQALTCENEEKDYPFMIYLLDEANLSQIEYYWSIFLRWCDTTDAEKCINLGGDKNIWKLPCHMKFIATVNFDHTTEELSPRFLDRSWIIMLEPEEFEISSGEESEKYKDIKPYSYKKVCEYFVNNNTNSISEACKAKWEDLQRVCKNYYKPIMPRSIKMIEDYMKVACEHMDQDSAETRLAPLDYAFSQKILPNLNGYIEVLVDELIKEVENAKMPLCEKHLRRMKKDAENNMGYCQFFSHKIGG